MIHYKKPSRTFPTPKWSSASLGPILPQHQFECLNVQNRFPIISRYYFFDTGAQSVASSFPFLNSPHTWKTNIDHSYMHGGLYGFPSVKGIVQWLIPIRLWISICALITRIQDPKCVKVKWLKTIAFLDKWALYGLYRLKLWKFNPFQPIFWTW